MVVPWLRMGAVALFFAGGIVAADHIRPSAAAAWLVGAVGIGAVVTTFLAHRRRPKPGLGDLLPRLSRVSATLVLAAAMAIGFADLGLRAAALRTAALSGLDGEWVVIEGDLRSDPAPSGRATRFVIRARAVEGRPVRALMVVRAFGRAPSLSFGDRIRLHAKIRRLNEADPFEARLARRWISAQATASGAEVRVARRASNPALRLANHIRERMEALARSSRNPVGGALVLGLTIGDERLIPESVQEAFRTSGLAHLLAVSGANVAMVLGAVVVTMRALRASRRLQVLAGMASIVAFCVVTRLQPSVLRAGLMTSVALAAFFFGRGSDPLHVLGLTFVSLLAVDPGLLWSIGFQLSFAATLGILVVSPPLVEKLRRLPAGVGEVAAVGAGAQIGVLPLLASHFGQLSVVALPANLIAFPLVAAATVLGFAGGLLGLLWRPLGARVFEGAAIFASGLSAVSQAFAALPHASVGVSPIGIAMVLAACLTGGALLTRFRARRAAAAAGILAVVVAVAGWGAVRRATSPPAPGGLRLTFFDVGQGDAALVESSGGARVLVDGGPDPEAIASTLRRRRLRSLDLVAFSHPHADHVMGLASVLARFPVAAAIDPGVPSIFTDGATQHRPEDASAGDRFQIGDLTIDVLGPDPDLRASAIGQVGARPGGGALDVSSGREGSAVNDASLVLRIGWGSGCALFSGDLEEEGQRWLLQRWRRAVDCTVLKAPHHGSARLVPEFVTAVDPEFVTISAGRRNDYGHPTRRALSIFERAGARVLRTDRLGDIILEMDEQGRVKSR